MSKTILDVASRNILITRKRSKPIREPKEQQLKLFWTAPMEALFGDITIAPVTGRSIKTLQCDRWRKSGIPFRKVGGRVLYSKADVIAWLESHPLVQSTSQYEAKGGL